MSDFTEKVRGMLDAATEEPWNAGDESDSHYDVRIGETICSLSRAHCHTGEYVISRDEMIANAHLVISAPTLLREACEYIEALEELHEIVRWEKECEDFQRPPSRKFQTHLGHISWLDAKKAKDNWKSKGWRSLARIYGNAWMQKQDALSDLDKQEASDAQDR